MSKKDGIHQLFGHLLKRLVRLALTNDITKQELLGYVDGCYDDEENKRKPFP
jgi:hypothetical protein